MAIELQNGSALLERSLQFVIGPTIVSLARRGVARRHRGHRGHRVGEAALTFILSRRQGAGAIGASPMPPMIPMPVRTVGSLHGISRGPPFSGGCLASENKAGDPDSGESFELGGDKLATAILLVDEMPDIGVDIACSDRMVAVSIPPGGEQFDGGLPASVPAPWPH